MKDDIIKILKQVLNEDLAKPYIKYIEGLEKDSNFLQCLESAGVDSWSGYNYAEEPSKEDDD